jgi:hypothetical protein
MRFSVNFLRPSKQMLEQYLDYSTTVSFPNSLHFISYPTCRRYTACVTHTVVEWTIHKLSNNLVPRQNCPMGDGVAHSLKWRGYGLDRRGFESQREKLFSPVLIKRKLTVGPIYPQTGICQPFLRGERFRDVKLINYLHLVSRLRMPGAISPLSIRLHGVVFMCTGVVLPLLVSHV